MCPSIAGVCPRFRRGRNSVCVSFLHVNSRVRTWCHGETSVLCFEHVCTYTAEVRVSMNVHSSQEVRASCPFADSRPDGCVCIALQEPKRVSVDYQARFCLTDRHIQCRRFQRAVPEVPDSSAPRTRSWNLGAGAFIGVGAAVAVLIIVLAAFTFHSTWSGWFTSRPSPSAGAQSGTTINVQPTTIVLRNTSATTGEGTPTRSSIPILAATPTSSSAALATQTPMESVSANSSATITPSPTQQPSPTPQSTPTPVPVTPTPGPSPTPVLVQNLSTPAVHVVKSGDTLTTISKAYGVSATLIAAANNLGSVNIISTGTTLYIPNANGLLPNSAPNLGIHIVQPGDSLSAIASSFGVTIQNVMLANGIANASHIEVGQVLTIPRGNVAVPTPIATPAPATTPTPTAPSGPQTKYVVQAHDTLYSIAKLYGVTIQSIMQANGLTDRTHIEIGQVLIIP